MEIKGKIVQVLEPIGGISKTTNKEWKKQEFILETTDSQYPKKICFNLWGDVIDRANLQMGEDVTVQVDVESREYNGRWYTEVRGWRVDRGIAADAPQQPYAAAPQPGVAPVPSAVVPSAPANNGANDFAGSGDDLPF